MVPAVPPPNIAMRFTSASVVSGWVKAFGMPITQTVEKIANREVLFSPAHAAFALGFSWRVFFLNELTGSHGSRDRKSLSLSGSHDRKSQSFSMTGSRCLCR
jgi:hypothetical protein